MFFHSRNSILPYNLDVYLDLVNLAWLSASVDLVNQQTASSRSHTPFILSVFLSTEKTAELLNHQKGAIKTCSRHPRIETWIQCKFYDSWQNLIILHKFDIIYFFSWVVEWGGVVLFSQCFSSTMQQNIFNNPISDHNKEKRKKSWLEKKEKEIITG